MLEGFIVAVCVILFTAASILLWRMSRTGSVAFGIAAIVILLSTTFFATKSATSVTPAVAAEHAAMAKGIAALKKGDFIVTNDGKVVLVIRDVADGYVQLKEGLWMPAALGEMTTSVMAKRAKQVVPYGHRDWPETAHKFLAP